MKFFCDDRQTIVDFSICKECDKKHKCAGLNNTKMVFGFIGGTLAVLATLTWLCVFK